MRMMAEPAPHRKAMYGTVCGSCGNDILPGAGIALRRGEAIHAGCASGGDDA
jgi:hypothetical protein